MLRKNVGWMLAIVLVLSMLSACGKGTDKASDNASANNASPQSAANEKPKEKVKLTFLNGYVETVDWFNEKIKQFNKQNEGIEVQQEFQKEASNALKIKIASGDVPDVVLITFQQEMFDLGYFVDLSNKNEWWDRINPNIKTAAKDKNGKNFTLPLAQIYQGEFYNKKIINELGLKEATTWDEFVNNLKTVKEKKPGVVPLFDGGKESWTLGQKVIWLALDYYNQKLGVNDFKKIMYANDKEKLGFDQPGSPLEVFANDFLDLQKGGLLNKDASTATYESELEAIANGKAAYTIQGMWALGEILKKNPAMKDDIGFAPMPPLFPGMKAHFNVLLDGTIGITSKSKHQEEVKKFLDFLTTPDVLKSFSKLRNSPSVFNDAQTDWSVLSADIAQMTQKGVPVYEWTPTPMGYNQDDMGKTVQDLLVGGIKSPGEFAKKFKENWDRGFLESK